MCPRGPMDSILAAVVLGELVRFLLAAYVQVTLANELESLQ